MNLTDSKLIKILLIIIIVCCIILIYKIKKEPEYNQKKYDEIYYEYDKILEAEERVKLQEENNNDSQKTILKDKEKEKNNIHIYANQRGDKYRVIGKIEIPKIKISYPIVYETTDEYLKIAPTKLIGPNTNEEGNLCVVGHNYRNNQFFSKIKKLDIDDYIYLTSNDGEKLKYTVYDKYEVEETDLKCISQDTDGKIESTLITCTNDNKRRLVIKCRVV